MLLLSPKVRKKLMTYFRGFCKFSQKTKENWFRGHRNRTLVCRWGRSSGLLDYNKMFRVLRPATSEKSNFLISFTFSSWKPSLQAYFDPKKRLPPQLAPSWRVLYIYKKYIYIFLKLSVFHGIFLVLVRTIAVLGV